MSTAVEQIVETIRAMKRQEEMAYSVSDYLSCLPTVSAALDTPVDASCRFVMAKWCNEIADFCNYKRETVAVAMRCLDCFMSTPNGRKILLDRNLYQLAAMTALYSSVKIHEQEAMDPKLVSSLSRGAHSPEAVERMEFEMLSSIQWRVNPPTAMSFVRSMIQLVPRDMIRQHEKEAVVDIAKLQIESIVNEYDFCTFDQSSVALACMLNAIESVTNDGMCHANLEDSMRNLISVDYTLLRNLRIATYELMNESNRDDSMQTGDSPTSNKLDKSYSETLSSKGSGFNSSPRTIAVPTR